MCLWGSLQRLRAWEPLAAWRRPQQRLHTPCSSAWRWAARGGPASARLSSPRPLQATDGPAAPLPPLPQCEDGLLASRSSAEAAAVVAQLALLQSTVEPLLAPTGGFHSKVRPRGRRSAASEARSGTWQLRSRHVLCGGSPSGRPAPPVPPQAAH